MEQRRSLLIPILFLSFAASGLLAATNRVQVAVRPVVTPYKVAAIYAIGDKAGWTIAAPGEGQGGKYTYSLKENNLDVLQTGTIDTSEKPATIECTSDHPEMLYLELKPLDGAGRWVFGAAIAPTNFSPDAPRPKDFDAFWRAKIAELKKVPMNPVFTSGESNVPGVDYGTLVMDHVNGTHVYGQFAKPSKPGKYPAILVLQWASPPYPLQQSWATNLAAKGFLVLNIEPHDVLPTESQAYYQALPDSIKHYDRIGRDDRDKSYFVEMYLRDYRAADWLTERQDWDGKTLVVTGGSMGGQQSLCVAGLHPKISHLIVEEPAGCDMHAALFHRQEGYPNFPVNDPKVMETAGYVDAVNFASHIRATCLVAMGFVDTIAPPAGIWTAFNQIRGPKEVVPLVEAPHNNTATYQQQLPYYQRMGAWIDALARGEKVQVRSGI